MGTNAIDWSKQWTDALATAKAGIGAFETRCQTQGIKDAADRLAADSELAIAITQLALLGGLPWTDGGAWTLERARYLLDVARRAIDGIEAQQQSRN